MRRKRLDTIFIACLLSLVYDRLICEPTHMTPTRNFVQFVDISNTSNSRTSSMNYTVIESSSFSTNYTYSQWYQLNISKHLAKSYPFSVNSSSPVIETKSVNVTSSPNINDVMPKQINSELKNKVLRRSRRDVLLLYKVVSCAGCNPMHLMGYGCYCGFMGAGIPVDGIDKCCQVHDWCYDRLPCPSFMLYFIPYKWECRNGSSQCYSQNPKSCGYHMCQCDRMFAECLKQQPCPKQKVFCKSAPWRLIQNLLFDFGIAG